jgi:hypothetical protein
MENFDDSADPLDLAFANPKAGKKLKPGEVLPGMEGAPSRVHALDDIPTQSDAILSQALDDAFSNPNFGAVSDAPPVRRPVISENTAAIEAKLARNLDDAFANPKAGNKIEDATGLENLGLGSAHASPSLDSPRFDDLHLDHIPAKTGKMFGPKFLVIAMVLGVVVVAAVMRGSDTTATKPTILQLD